MKTVAFETGIATSGNENWLSEKLKSIFTHPTKPAELEISKTTADEVDHVNVLLECIENGFIVEETGELTKLPRFALMQLKTNVITGGWV